MPDRFIRESALASETLGGLTDFAERLFWRLTTAADDFGRFNANPRFILGRCMPLVAGATPRRIADALAELEAAGTVSLYEVDRKSYGYFPDWSKYQQTRAKKSKYPEPPTFADECLQMPTFVSDSDKAESAPNTNTHTNTDSSSSSPEFEDFWKAYPRREHRSEAERSWLKLEAEDRRLALADIPERMKLNWAGRERQHIPHAASYLNQRQWRDELAAPTARASPGGPMHRNQLEMDRIKARMARTTEETAGEAK